jgi:hypothetical protein
MSDVIKRKDKVIDRSKVLAYESLNVPAEVETFKKGLTSDVESEPLLVTVIEDAFELGFALAVHMMKGDE